MKVLLIHNYYVQRGGEDIVFEKECRLLKENNVEIITYFKHNKDSSKLFGKIKMAFNMVWSFDTYKELREIIERERPDVAHFHNIWYNISPSAYYVCKKFNIPIVQTLHNFRIFCANGLMFRNGNICEKCLNNLSLSGFLYGCYRNSRIQTLPIFFTEYIHKILGTWKKTINAYIVLTEFSKKIFTKYGIDETKIFVKPNFIFDIPISNERRYDYFLYVGRLSYEKGLMQLLEAYRILCNNYKQVQLKIIGNGPLYNDIEDYKIKYSLHNLDLLGHLDEIKISEYMKNALAVILPSVWYEMFPIVIIEAYRSGKAVIVPNIGSFLHTVKNLETGLFFEYGNINDLVKKMEWAIENLEKIKWIGNNARKHFEEKYTPGKNIEYLLDIYNKVVNEIYANSKR